MSFSSSFTIDIADSFPRLPKAPIIEAMIYWKAPIGDTPTLPELTDELTRRLPNYPIVRSQQNISISASFSADGTSEIDHTAQPGLRLEDKNRHIAQVTPNSITLSRLEPYNRWEAFKAEALDFWDIFAELRKPDELQQVGVRYINRIPLNVGETPDTYLKFVNSEQEAIGLHRESFFYQDIYPIPNYPYSVKMVRTMQPQPSIRGESKVLIIDIDVVATTLIQPNRETLIQKLNEMRWIKNQMFFNCISETALESYKG